MSSSWTSWIHVPPQTTVRHVVYGIIIGYSLSLTTASVFSVYQSRKRKRMEAEFEREARPIEIRTDEIALGVTGIIGNTPLVRINSLSDALGIEILGKAEFLNPGGSVKDRVALRMIYDAERQGLLHPYTGSRIFEGTVGSTGISIATIARARGYDATIIMPDDVAMEKVRALTALSAEVIRVRPTSIVDKNQFVNIARQCAREFGKQDIIRSTSSLLVSGEISDNSNQARGYFADQFENKSNYLAHFDGTGPEIWRQTNGKLNAFVSGAGTGGTLAGIGQYLKSCDEDIIVALSDPEGSGLYNRVKYGVMYDPKEAEGTKRRHQVDTVVEGIGLNRITNNLQLAFPIIDDAFRVTDAEAVAMSRYLVQNDGLFLGSSSACNVVGAIKLAKSKGWNEGQVVVTILCDSGARHYSKFWNDDYLRNASIPMDLSIVDNLLQTPIVL